MAVLSIQKIVNTGLEPAALAAAAGGGDSFRNTGHEFIEVAAVGADRTITIAAQRNCDFGVDSADHDKAIVVTAGERRFIGPFDPAKYNDANGLAQITYSSATGVTLAVFGFGGA